MPAEIWAVHYFDTNFDKSLGWYSSHFASARPDQKRGEITPAYQLLSLPRIRFIHRIMPDVRLFFLMRNPVDRAWSHTKMYFFVQEKLELEQVTLQQYVKHFRDSASIQRGDYERTLDRWFSVFPREQLHFDFFDRISEEPDAVMRGILRHIGLDHEVDLCGFPLSQVVHKGVEAPIPPEAAAILREIYAPKIRRLADRLDVPKAWLL
jgi:Sulfotransferase family